MRRACIIGWPVAHSRSPMIHNCWLGQHQIDGSYEHAAVAPEDFDKFFSSLSEQGFIGGNVTLPHKHVAFALCDKTTPIAARLEAVNTFWFEDGRLCGDNTDGEGFLGSLDESAPGWDERTAKAVVLGAGGAARAIVHALEARKIKRIIIVNRTRARAEEVAAAIDGPVEVEDWAKLGQALDGADLLVNTTSLGMKGQPELEIDLTPLANSAIVSDIVYVPLETELLAKAKARGLVTSGGLSMLLHQAVPGFQRWFGVRPRVTPELTALVEADIRAAG
jgi:shikimate dehydrogenase